VLGLLAVLDSQPMEDSARIESILQIFAGRAASELERERADDALRASEASYRAIFEASEDAIFVHELDTGRILDINKKACEIYGYTHEEMLEATVGDARTGVLHLPHGDVPTPAFMPVGTRATVRALGPDDLRELGSDIVLANTYHLWVRPGHELIRELGGLHAFMRWDGPILTDSGGYQVFSMRDRVKISEEGARIRSPYGVPNIRRNAGRNADDDTTGASSAGRRPTVKPRAANGRRCCSVFDSTWKGTTPDGSWRISSPTTGGWWSPRTSSRDGRWSCSAKPTVVRRL